MKRARFPLVFATTFERHGVTYRGTCEGVTVLGSYVTRVTDVGLFFVAPNELRYES